MPLQVPAHLPPPLDASLTGSPPRRPGSVRRTATIYMVWPDGWGTPLRLVGRARDLATPRDGAGEPVVLGRAEMQATIGPERVITAIETVPSPDGIEGLIGTQAGSYLRGAIDDALPGEREAATPLHVLLDDIAGTSLIAGFAVTRWQPGLFRDMARRAPDFGVRKGKVICSGLRPEGWAQTTRAAGEDPGHAVRPAGDISTPDDPWGWHEWPERPPMCMRRHRRIDVRRVAGAIVVDSFFRDSCWEPDGSELSLHEYSVEAEVDANAHTLNAVRATPRVLPFPECQWAAPNVDLIIGMHVDRFRTSVQETLTELQCCTHLNDMLRGLAEVPKLAAALD